MANIFKIYKVYYSIPSSSQIFSSLPPAHQIYSFPLQERQSNTHEIKGSDRSDTISSMNIELLLLKKTTCWLLGLLGNKCKLGCLRKQVLFWESCMSRLFPRSLFTGFTELSNKICLMWKAQAFAVANPIGRSIKIHIIFPWVRRKLCYRISGSERTLKIICCKDFWSQS